MSDYKTALSAADVEKVISGETRVDFKASAYWGKAWERVQSDFGGTAILGLVLYFLNVVGLWLNAGLFQGMYKENKGGEKMDMNSLFKGFDHGKPLLMLLLISMGAAMLLLALPYMLIIIGAVAEAPAIAAIGGLIFFIGYILFIIFSVSHFHSVGLVTFAGMEAMDSIKASAGVVKKHIGGLIVFMIISSLVNMAGALLCFVGLIITVPMTYMATYYAFEDVFKLESKGAEYNNDEIIDHLV